MKKLSPILLAVIMVLSLAACSDGNPSSSDGDHFTSPVSSSQPSPTPLEESESSEAAAPDSDPEEATEADKALVAYFSWSGNTRQMAEIIAQEAGADLFEINTVTPYTDNYDELLDIARQEQSDHARPALDTRVENWDSYGTIFVGYPNWWNDAPMAVYTFLESYDFNGKRLIPFNTSASGGFGRSLADIEESVAGATILEGLALTEDDLGDTQNRVATWLEGLGLNR